MRAHGRDSSYSVDVGMTRVRGQTESRPTTHPPPPKEKPKFKTINEETQDRPEDKTDFVGKKKLTKIQGHELAVITFNEPSMLTIY